MAAFDSMVQEIAGRHAKLQEDYHALMGVMVLDAIAQGRNNAHTVTKFVEEQSASVPEPKGFFTRLPTETPSVQDTINMMSRQGLIETKGAASYSLPKPVAAQLHDFQSSGKTDIFEVVKAALINEATDQVGIMRAARSGRPGTPTAL